MKKLTPAQEKFISVLIPNAEILKANTNKVIAYGPFNQRETTPLVRELVDKTFQFYDAITSNRARLKLNNQYPDLKIKSPAKAVQLFDRTKYICVGS